MFLPFSFHPLLLCSYNQKWTFPFSQAQFNLPPCQQLVPPQHSQRHFGHCQDSLHCQRKDSYPPNQWNLCQTQLSFQYSEHFISACVWGSGNYLVATWHNVCTIAAGFACSRLESPEWEPERDARDIWTCWCMNFELVKYRKPPSLSGNVGTVTKVKNSLVASFGLEL